MALFAPASRLSHLLAPSIARSSHLLFSRLISESTQNQHDEEASNAPKSVPVSTAFELISSGYTFLDVRTPKEFKSGHPSGAKNIAYMFQTEEGMMKKNPQFQQEVMASFTKDDKIIIGCRSGKRSLMAAADLTSLGYKHVVDVAGGYISWIANRLPVHKPE